MTLALILLLGCGGKADDSGASCSDRVPALNWTNFGEALFTSHCTGCHHALNPEVDREGAPLGVDFDTWQGVTEHLDLIEARTVPEDGGMPPAGPLSAEDRAMLAEWISCGAPP